MKTYIILGHGSERIGGPPPPIIPPGCALLLVEECGSEGTIPPHVYAALDDPSISISFTDPVRNLSQIQAILGLEVPPKLYSEGESYPNLNLSLLGKNTDDTEDEDEDDDPVIEPSGIWPLPSPVSFAIGDKTATNISKYESDNVMDAFSGSIYPPKSKFRGHTKYSQIIDKTYSPFLYNVTMNELFTENPGLYIHLLCRTIHEYGKSDIERNLEPFLPSNRPRTNVGNIYPVIRNWITEKSRHKTLTKAQRSAIDTVRVHTNRVLAQRRTRKAHDESTWTRIYNGLHSKTNNSKLLPLVLKLASTSTSTSTSTPTEIDRRNRHDSFTLLMAAADNGRAAIVTALLQIGANPFITTLKTGATALFFARTVPVINSLLERAPTLRTGRDKWGATPLHYAAERNSPQNKPVIEHLVHIGIPVNAIDEDGDSPLHYAAKANAHVAVECLLEIPDIQIDLGNTDGFTPFLTAIKNESYTVAVMLIWTRRINLNARTVSGKSALSFLLNQYKQTAEPVAILLVEYGYIVDLSTLAKAAGSKGFHKLRKFALELASHTGDIH